MEVGGDEHRDDDDPGRVASAGWYQDPFVPGVTRYFDGEGWTESRQPDNADELERLWLRRQAVRHRVFVSTVVALWVCLTLLTITAITPFTCVTVDGAGGKAALECPSLAALALPGLELRYTGEVGFGALVLAALLLVPLAVFRPRRQPHAVARPLGGLFTVTLVVSVLLLLAIPALVVMTVFIAVATSF